MSGPSVLPAGPFTAWKHGKQSGRALDWQKKGSVGMITIKKILVKLGLVRERIDGKPRKHELLELIDGMNDQDKHAEVEFKPVGKETL